jgi:hypothetical protein
MDEARTDLSPLDPGRDPDRFERMVRSVLDRADAPPPHPFASALVARGRVAVVIAAALAALAWIPVPSGKSGTALAASGDPVATVAAWAQAGTIPDGVDVYHELGVNDVR